MMQLKSIRVLTATTLRTQRVEAMNKTKEEIEQIAELVVDAVGYVR